MGSRGPKRKPTLLAAAAGGEAPSPPAEVAACPAALEVWNRTLATLRTLGTWHRADAGAVGRYAVLAVLHARYQAACLRGDDIAVVGNGGYSTPTPSMTGMLKTAAALLSLERQLGLVAAARRDFPAPPTPQDELDVWLAANP